MRAQLVWLSLYFTLVWAIEQGNRMRIRATISPFFNTSKSVGSSGTLTTSTSTSNRITTPRSRERSDTETRGPPSETQTREPPEHSNPDAITHTTSCIKSVETITESILDTVYITVDGSYEVRVTASNASLVAPTIYETPLQACTTTIVPRLTAQPVSSNLNSSPGPTMTRPPPGFVKETSTIVVTKKTPISIIDPTDQGPPVTFPTGKPDSASRTDTPQQNLGTSNDGSGVPSNGNGSPVTSNGNANPVTTPASRNGANPTGTGNVGAGPASRETPVINGVTVIVNPSNVIIGSQTVTLPVNTQAVVVINSQTFTVRPSEIAGAGTTYFLGNQVAAPVQITQVSSVVTSAGVVATIGPSVAVISGTSYRIGAGAPSATLVVNGQTIAIGSDGVAFSGPTPTTYAPAMTIASGYQIVVVDGMTVYIDQTVAVISGTTYKVGVGATPTTVNSSGTTVVIGPGGVVLPSTTVKPATVPTITTISKSGSADTVQFSSSSSSSSSSGSGSRFSDASLLPLDLLRLLTWIAALLPSCLL